MEKLSTKELFTQLQEKLIIKLEENEIVCPECKGLRFVLVEKNESAYIENCKKCYNGKQYICKHCGKGNGTSHCNCKEATKERNDAYNQKQAQKEFEAYQKAEKIHYKDYDGKFLLEHNDYIQDIESVSEWIYDKLADGEDVPEYLWALEGERVFSIDLKEVISDKCEDGYEDMFDHLDTKSPLLIQAQGLIDKWQDEQGNSLNIYTETYKKAVIIKDLVEEIRKQINCKHEKTKIGSFGEITWTECLDCGKRVDYEFH